jgi:acyl carrier protein
MDRNDITNSLKTLFVDIFSISEDEIFDESSPDTIENWNSFQHLQLILAIEESFGVSLTVDEVTEIQTFANVRDLLIQKGV